MPLSDGQIAPGLYEDIQLFSSPLLTKLPKNSFGLGVATEIFILGSGCGVISFDPEFLGGPSEAQHVKSIDIFNSIAT